MHHVRQYKCEQTSLCHLLTLLLFLVAMNPPRSEGQSCSNVAGSPFYTSPEQRAGLPIKRNQAQKIDMFAVGVVFFELYCPFNTEMERHTVRNKYTLSQVHCECICASGYLYHIGSHKLGKLGKPKVSSKVY